GNVLGSRGSVVPIFQAQIEQRGPVTVTHPDVRRYFMTIPESVQLVLQAGTMGAGGETFVLDMGEQIRLADLARDMIRLQGLEEGRDIEIVYTGLLPGEKLAEELFYETDVVEPTIHEKILVCRNSVLRSAAARPGTPFAEDLTLLVEDLLRVTMSGTDERIIDHLRRIVPQYRPPTPASVSVPAAIPAASPAVHPQPAIS
ncbi:MAG TPA: polysaccharide biosynthesis protein, partial [Bacteroidota bacterium]